MISAALYQHDKGRVPVAHLVVFVDEVLNQAGIGVMHRQTVLQFGFHIRAGLQCPG